MNDLAKQGGHLNKSFYAFGSKTNIREQFKNTPQKKEKAGSSNNLSNLEKKLKKSAIDSLMDKSKRPKSGIHPKQKSLTATHSVQKGPVRPFLAAK